MNSIIETLNIWGQQTLRFAWPMLWQSSLLIGILFIVDRVLRRKIRAAVRYALWLVVLLKLMLPASLALPTGLAWWLRQSPPSPPKPQNTVLVIRSGPIRAPLLPMQSTTLLRPPPSPTLSRAAWLLLFSTGGSLSLLVFMLLQWRRTIADNRRAAPPPDWLLELLRSARQQANVPWPVTLRLTDCPMSPALSGLLRPVILLPNSVATRLSPVQLRAVLLHELMHLRRGDILVSLAQALLQIIYWWHPLLWFANSRIRRLREEAVDDCVMLALQDHAETYPATLLEVARMTFQRPLASLGLVGILESKHSLRQRIERLLNFRKPSTPGLTCLSVIAVFAFGAVAVPMGEPPLRQTPESQSAQYFLGRVSAGQSKTATNVNSFARANGRIQETRSYPLPKEFVRHDEAPLEKAIKELFTGSFMIDYERNLVTATGTAEQLDVMEQIIQGIRPAAAPPQINIKTKFIEVDDSAAEFLLNWLPAHEGVALTTNVTSFSRIIETTLGPESIPARNSAGLTGKNLLSDPQFRLLTRTLEQREGVHLLSEGSVTTLSGRQIQIQHVEEATVITNWPPGIQNLFQTQQVFDGPTLDIVPTVTNNGESIQMTVLGSLTEFLGYDDPGSGAGTFIQAQSPLPHFAIRQITTTASLRDGQTLMLGGLVRDDSTKSVPVPGDIPGLSQLFQTASGHPKKHLLFFITPTIIDSAGNPVHKAIR